jgi:fatty acid desaturase (delta-4 desaturase)
MSSSPPGLIRIDDVIYDAERLAAMHPGGPLFVLQADGTDATALYNTSHRRPFAHEKYRAFALDAKALQACGVAVPAKVTAKQNWASYWELCERLKPVLDGPGGNNGFAPWHYFVKVFFLVAGVLALDAYFLAYGRTLLLSLLAGLLRANVGLNVQHDANHGAVSRTPIVNRLLGLTQDYIGGSSIGWMINHNVGHHTVCNDTVRDGDLDIGLIRLKKAVPWLPVHRVQHIYVWLLEAMFGPVHMVQNAVFNWFSAESRRPLLVPFFNLNRALSFVTIARIVATYWLHPSSETVWLTVVEYCFGGLWLAFFFLLSHNFEGVRKEGIDYGAGTDFVQNQVETSSNVGGWTLIQTNGGLNIQIEHHMFPRVSHCHYDKMLPIVRGFCREKGFRYVHFPTLWDNVVSTYRHLRSLGAAAS